MLAHDNYQLIIIYLFYPNLARIIIKNIACIGEKIVYINAWALKQDYYGIYQADKHEKQPICMYNRILY
ncbi:MAG TPA: hypothetical protein VIJ27_10930 [Mucilaginibacter sp.]|jgi:hypothetical protein